MGAVEEAADEMGTRSLTAIVGDGEEILVMYRQMDGDPSGHGAELANFLAPMKMTNGISVSDAGGKTANGPACLAAQLVREFKNEGPGSIYLHKAGSRDIGEEYLYVVDAGNTFAPGQIILSVYEIHAGYGTRPRKETLLFKGRPGDYDLFRNVAL